MTNEPGWVTIVKPADTNRTSTTTVTDDPDLQFTMESGVSYFIDLFVNLYVRANPDFKYTLNVPSGFFRAMERITAQNTTITTDIITSAPANTVISASVDNYGFLRIMGPYATSASGTFSLQWAQNTSDGSNAATVVAGSALRYFKF